MVITKRKILVVMASPFKSGLAPENYIRTKALIDNPENEIDIICFPIGEDIKANNVRIRRIPGKKLFKIYQIGNYKNIIIYTLCMILGLVFKKDKKYDVIFLFNASYLFFWFIKPLFKGKTVAMVYSPLEEETGKWEILRNKLIYNLLKRFDKFVLKKYDKIVFNLERVRKKYEKKKFGLNKLVLIPHAWESNLFLSKNENEDNTFRILYTGSFVKVQNIDLIYKIAALLKNYKKIRFDLIGADQNEYISEKNKLENLSLQNVFIHKRVNITELSAYYKNADVLISCRIYGEDLPFKIIEYMSWGKCILATDLPIHNSVLNNEVACLVEPDAEIMANEIINLYENPDIVKDYKLKVSNFFNQYYSIENLRKSYKDLIGEFFTA